MLLYIEGMGQTTAERLGFTIRAEHPALHPGNWNNTAYMKRYLGQRFKDRPFERLRQYFAMQRPPEIKQKELQTIVATNVSYTVLPFEFTTHYIWIDESMAMVPVTIEVSNGKLSFFKQGDIFKARIGIYGRVSTLLGEVVTEFDDTVSTQYRKEQSAIIHKLNSVYQKVLSVPPGRYKLDLVIKDLTSGDIGTVTSGIHLKKLEAGKIGAGSLFLAKKLETLTSFTENLQSFVIGDVRVVPSVNRSFRPNEDLGIYLQVYNTGLDSTTLLPSVSVEYRITRDSEIVSEFLDTESSSLEFTSARRIVLMNKFDLDNFETGH
jgi:hypothetical protein